MTAKRFGLSCAISTPFAATGPIDIPRLIAHAKQCKSEGCDSITLFGTTGEGFSVGPKERAAVYDAFKNAGFNMRTEVGAGIMAASVEEAAAQAKQALDAGCKHLLLAPPFYIKGVSDDGLFAWHSELFRALGSNCRDIILYNLPGQTAVTISHDLVTRLRKAHPGVITAIKDSSGNWPYTERMLKDHGDIAILIGDERHLAKAVRLGGQGSICGLANSHAALLRPLVYEGHDNPLVNKLVDTVVSFPVLPSVKALIAAKTKDTAWLTVRAPLVQLTADQHRNLLTATAALTGSQ
jgi:4-hydroxy-tetrahydrodipicolinate synthase